MLRSEKTALAWLPVLLLAFLTVLLTWLRAPYGVDVTDDAFWVAEPYLITQGAVPFVDGWSQTPLTSLLLAPFVALYLALAGSTEGIVLYMVHAAIFFRLAVAIATWRLLRDGMDSRIAAICALLSFSIVPFSNRMLNYNTLFLSLLALSGALLYSAACQPEVSKAARRCAGAGVAMALCALAHVMQAANCLLLFIVLLFTERRKWKNLPLWLIYALPGLAVAALVVLGLEIAGGGGLFSGILTVLDSNYFHIPRYSPAQQLYHFARSFAAFVLRRWLPLFLFCFAALTALACLKKRAYKDCLPTVFALAATLASCGILALSCWRRQNPNPSIMVLFLTAPLYLLSTGPSERRMSLRLLGFFWLPSLSSCLMIALASFSNVTSRYYTLLCGAMLSVPFAFQALQGRDGGPAPRRAALWRSFVPSCLLGALFSASMLTYFWSFVYRDDPIPQLAYRIETGVYKGCYTSPERGKAIETLEDEIRSVTSAGETVLIADLLPTAYLMTDARHCTPFVWDPCMYRYDFQDAGLYLQYFQLHGAIPDKILYINSEGLPLSIDDPDNEFADFVHGHYTLAEQFGEGLFSMRVFVRKPDQAPASPYSG